MIVQIQPHRVITTNPPLWTLYYKDETEFYFNEIHLTYERLKLFLEKYGYETNNLDLLINFGIETKNIKENKKL
jgi:hypothetical protein